MTLTVTPTRRTFIRVAAWTTPVVMVVAASPAFATSHEPPIIIDNGPVESAKCPGRSTEFPFTYIFTFELTSPPAPGTFNVNTLIINGESFAVSEVVFEGNTVHIVSFQSTNSANASGSGSVTYQSGGVDRTFNFTYDGSHPDQQLCERLAS